MDKFKINVLSWYKRRKPTKEPQPMEITVVNFKKERGHFCEVIAQYDDGVERKLNGRVLFNEIRKEWTINAIANGGFNVSATLIED